MKVKDNNEIKEAIKFKIYEKSVLAFKYAFNSNFDQYADALKHNQLRPFSISADTLRSVDKLRIVNGKKTWLCKIAIQELIDEGCLIVSDSYCTAPQHNFAKSYALTVDKLKEVLEFVKVNIKIDDARSEWNESKSFMDGFDVIETDGKWLSDVYYTADEKKKAIEEFKRSAEYAEYCRKNAAKDIYTYFEETKQWN